MSALYSLVFRRILFLLPSETAHALAAVALRLLHRFEWLRRWVRRPLPARVEVAAMGRTFASPIGMAAGFDKSAEMFNGLGALGFSFVEIGTVTAHGQPGNPRPRLFRLPRDRALINRMGFNNPGAQQVANRLLANAPDQVVLGINIGKSKITPLETAADDYAESARALGPYAQYMVINVSSPNTPGLRSLQTVESLREIALRVRSEIAPSIPMLVKIAPDLANEDIDAIADLALELGLAGLIATNTTIARDSLSLRTSSAIVSAIGAGGLSGAPLRARALEVIRRLYQRTAGRILIVGVGGIENADHVWDAIRAGATLVQIYTAMIYMGPGIARNIATALVAKLDASEYQSIRDVIGSEHRENAPRP